MSKTNCINCGAAKDTDEIKCPFCGTTYLDLTAIDFASGDPVVCQFVLPYDKSRAVLSMLAIPKLTDVSIHSTYTDVYGGLGSGILCRLETSREINVGVEFKPIARKHKEELLTVTLEP